ncbi:DUF47 family protein [Oscillospiraceae bacterium MB08-C2-2]|nr:DUF47 family protein [Oscillospiraceae bacterium MB08-C2-2]
MANKKSLDFFEAFTRQAGYCKKAADQLVLMLANYTDVTIRAEEIHVTEHEADSSLHEVMHELARCFVTPIDRDNIITLINRLDDITDAIEDVANLFDMLSITTVKPEVKTLADLIAQACSALYDAVDEFPRFKHSKTLNELIIRVNRLEEDGDRMHRAIIKNMYQQEQNAIELMKWKEIINAMENVLDYCEDVANLLDELAISNS